MRIMPQIYILKLIKASGESGLTLNDLYKSTDIPPNNVRTHCARLRSRGLVKRYPTGTQGGPRHRIVIIPARQEKIDRLIATRDQAMRDAGQYD